MEIFLVGGAVRDTLLGYPFKDRDWVVIGASVDEMLAQGFQQVGKDFPVFIHPKSKEEYALARTERKSGQGYKGFICHSNPDVTLEEDLIRRDLTINAMAMTNDKQIIDPYHGQRDIEQRILRHVSAAFTEDPLRVLRLARFYARYAHLGFTVADETLKLTQDIVTSGELNHLTAERLWKELEQALTEPSPDQFFNYLDNCGALEVLLPELSPLSNVNLSALKNASAQQHNSCICFALALANCAPNNAKMLCQRVKAPNEHKDLALLVSNYNQSLSDTASNAELLILLVKLDPFRRSQRFEDFLICCRLLAITAASIDRLRSAFKACKTIDNSLLEQQGYKGKAFADALKNERLRVISESIDHDQ